MLNVEWLYPKLIPMCPENLDDKSDVLVKVYAKEFGTFVNFVALYLGREAFVF